MRSVYFTDNPLEADEFVWVTEDPERAEETVAVRCSPHRCDAFVYAVDKTDELEALFAVPSEFARIRTDLSSTKQFSYRNCGVTAIDKVIQVV